MTEDNVGLAFSHSLPATESGSFSVDFLPTVHYPIGGVFTLKLIQDDQTYYEISNTDGYGPYGISKYINGEEVDSKLFQSGYSQNTNYSISVDFTPSETTVQAFGETIVISSDTTAITVNSFSIDTFQQDAYYDNIVYVPVLDVKIIEPVTGHIQTESDLSVKATAYGLQNGWG